MSKVDKLDVLLNEAEEYDHIFGKFKEEDVTSRVVDEFVRYLIGDKEQALTNLQKLKEKTLPVAQTIDPDDTAQYNNVFRELFDDIVKAVER